MVRTRYEIDPFNRLIVTGRDMKTGLPLYRTVVEGRFTVDKTNALIYQVTSPVRDAAVPRAIRLGGTWELTKDHDLRITLEHTKRARSPDVLTITGVILDARERSLLFGVTTKTGETGRRTYALELAGTWHADAQNRLSFRVRRGSGSAEAGTLLFQGAWDVSHNTLTYAYERRSRAFGETRAAHTVAFKGRWNIIGKNALTYAFDAGSYTAFTFRAGIGSFTKDRIDYELSIGYAHKRRPRLRTISIHGTWNIAKDTGLSFDVSSADGRKLYSIGFSAKARLTPRDTIEFALRDGPGRRDLAGSVELSHDIIRGDGIGFLRFLMSHDERAVHVGATMRW